MKCPVDGTTLEIAQRGGVEIDWCPQCRGVWLDRGELDKIIDQQQPPAPPRSAREAAPADLRRDDRDDRPARRYEDDEDDDDRRRPRKRRESFLSELFDF